MRPADAATLAGGVLAGASITLAVSGYLDLAVRILMLAYALDVLDGWLARRFGGASEEGLMLDRAFDRVSQVVAPLIVYAAWATPRLSPLDRALLAAYSGGIVAVAFWRLVKRVVWRLTHFAGLPMFAHAGVLLLSYIGDVLVKPVILIGLMIMSAVPVPYLRRLRWGSRNPSPGTLPRLLAVLIIAVLPYHAAPVVAAARVALAALLAYAAVGFIPPLLGLTPGPRLAGGGSSHR
ncbi:MAG: CDP-alcohol phosphatidyltransferase family protein [Desulfurococcales archaeon]|nr:CDP-alcohol phosphatidyltransferase family protein [Desulfurococcales archaeon]